MDKNPFLKYLIKEQKSDIVHSSAYGKAQNSTGMGVASTQSFSERMETEQNRKMVRKYNESRVTQQAFSSGAKAKAYTETVGVTEGGASYSVSGSKGAGVTGGGRDVGGGSRMGSTVNTNVAGASDLAGRSSGASGNRFAGVNRFREGNRGTLGNQAVGANRFGGGNRFSSINTPSKISGSRPPMPKNPGISR